MKKIFFYLSMILLVCSVNIACSDSDDNDSDSKKEVNLDKNTPSKIEFNADETTSEKAISFTTKGAWNAFVEEIAVKTPTKYVEWIQLDQYKGNTAGSHKINITLTPNLSGKERKAVIHITCGNSEIKVTVTQKAKGDHTNNGKLIKMVSVTVNPGKNSENSKDSKMEITFSYDQKGKVTEVKVYESDEYDKSETYYRMNYLSDKEISITAEDDVDKISCLAHLDDNGRIVTVEDEKYKNNMFDAEYNAAGQLTKFTNIYDEYSNVEFGYSNNLINSILVFDETISFPMETMYKNKYENSANIDINGIMLTDNDLFDILYATRLLGNGNKYLFENSLFNYFDSDYLIPSSHPKPNVREHVEFTINKSSNTKRIVPRKYEFKGDELVKYNDTYSFDIYKVEYDIVSSDKLYVPGQPEMGYLCEIQNKKETKIGSSQDIFNYTITY